MSCFRCGRRGHWASNCFAHTDVRGDSIEDEYDDSDEASESDDSAEDCEPVRRVQPQKFKKRKLGPKKVQPENPGKRKLEPSAVGVYALVASNGLEYVGKSDDVNARIDVHRQGNGARCLDGASVTKVPLLTQGCAQDLESWERNETLTRMYRRGINSVRGWMFVSKTLSEEQTESAFNQVCERFDLCRKCGRNSHFASACFAKSKAQWAT